jgi:hypothetical protein
LEFRRCKRIVVEEPESREWEYDGIQQSTRIRIGSVEFRAPAGQDMSLEAEELNRGIEASE